MSLLVRAALLGGLAYVVSRAVRSSRALSRSFPLADPKRLPQADESELQTEQTLNRLLATSQNKWGPIVPIFTFMLTAPCFVIRSNRVAIGAEMAIASLARPIRLLDPFSRSYRCRIARPKRLAQLFA